MVIVKKYNWLLWIDNHNSCYG